MWLIDLKNSQMEQPDLSDYVQIDRKNSQECTNNERNAFIIKITVKIVIIIDYDNNSSTVVYGVIF